MKTAVVEVKGNQIGILWQVLNRVQPQSMAEQRGHSRVMADFGLDLIEAKLLAGGPDAKIELPKDGIRCDVSEAGYLYLCTQWDKLKDLFPAGENPDGTKFSAGLPNVWSRIVAPIFAQLDKEFQMGDFAETKPTT